MAYYRGIHEEFYEDPEIIDVFTPDERFFYICCITNPRVRQCGIYKISVKQFVQYTGYNDDVIRSLIDRFENQFVKIIYNEVTKELALKNWFKWNKITNINIAKCVDKEFRRVVDQELIEYVKQSMGEDSRVWLQKATDERLSHCEPTKTDQRFMQWKQHFHNEHLKMHNSVISNWQKETIQLKKLLKHGDDEELSKRIAIFKSRMENPTTPFWAEIPFLPSMVNSMWDKLVSPRIITKTNNDSKDYEELNGIA